MKTLHQVVLSTYLFNQPLLLSPYTLILQHFLHHHLPVLLPLLVNHPLPSLHKTLIICQAQFDHPPYREGFRTNPRKILHLNLQPGPAPLFFNVQWNEDDHLLSLQNLLILTFKNFYYLFTRSSCDLFLSFFSDFISFDCFVI